MVSIFDPNPTLRRFNNLHDHLVRALRLPDRVDRRIELDNAFSVLNPDFRRDYVKQALSLITGIRKFHSEHLAGVLVSMMTGNHWLAIAAEERAAARRVLIDIGYSLAAYRAEAGVFPDSLDALIPAYFDSIPLDPFTDEPLIYELTDGGFLLYSVGENGWDDGGVMDTKTDRDDIAFGDVPKVEEAE